MKKIYSIVISLILFSCTFPTPPKTETPGPNPDPFDAIPWTDRSLFKEGLAESAQPVLEGLEGASVYHLDIDVGQDLDHISGHEQVQYTNTETVPLNEIRFRLFPNILGGEMSVSAATAGGQSITPSLQLNDSLLILPLPNPLDPGSNIVVGMDFKVTVPTKVELNYGVLAYYQGVLALAHAYPMIAVYDDEGWNAEIPPQEGDLTYADMSFFLVRITAPKDLTLVTTGRKMESSSAGATQTLTVANGPARDFYLAASALYRENSQTFGNITVRSYAPKESEKGAQQALLDASQSIEIFSSRYAPYPYTELDIVSTPTLALGIEYPGMIAITSRIYDVDQEVNGTPASIYLEATVAHEVGHQWFYNLVGNDQLDDPWLDESLTQFITLQYYEDEYGQQAASGFKESLEGRWASIDKEKIPIGLPVAEYDGREYSAIVYGRGPLFFVALRDEMGEAAFDAFLKDYTSQLSWNIATPEILQSLAEKHCACDLDQIFNEWVYR